MYAAKRPRKWPVLLVFIVASWLLIACGGRLANTNWPGLSTDGQTVYVAYGNGVFAYDVAAQQEAWLFSPEPGRLQFYAAPSVEDGRVVVGDFGAAGGFFSPGVVVSVYGLRDSGNGTLDDLWAQSGLASDRIGAAPLQVGDTAYVGTADNQVLAINATNGELRWSFATEHSVWARPAYKDGVLYVASLDRNVYALEAESGRELWRTPLSGAIAGQPLVDSDLLYVTSFDKQLHALSLTTGAEQWAVAAEDWIWGAAVMAGKGVYFADASGNVYAVDADTGAVNWTAQVDGAVQTTPAVGDGRLYIVSDTNVGSDEPVGVLTALDLDDGSVVWDETVGQSLFTAPVVVNGSVVVAVQGEETLLILFDAQSGTRQLDVPPPQASS